MEQQPSEQTPAGIPLQDPTMLPIQTMPILPMAAAEGATEGNGVAVPDAAANGISADEIALYDRQIRLWGMQAQEKIRNANVLLITMKALANEIAKNLVLAGIGSLTIVDHETVTEADLGAQFFLSADEGHVGMNRAEAASSAIRRLNPRVAVHVDTGNIQHKGPSYFAVYDVVVATDLAPDTLNVVNTATRLNQRAFYAAGTHGLYGFIFADLIEHDFVLRRPEPNVPTVPRQETKTRAVVAVQSRVDDGGAPVELVTKRELYSTWFLASDLAALPADHRRSRRRLRAVSPALSCLRALWEFQQLAGGRLPSHARADLEAFTKAATAKHAALALPPETLRSDFLRSFLQNVGLELAPVAAVVGGQLAQDVINVLGHSQQPIQNMVIFDGAAMEAAVYPLHPEGPLGAQLLSSGSAAAIATGPGGPVLGGLESGAAADMSVAGSIAV